MGFYYEKSHTEELFQVIVGGRSRQPNYFLDTTRTFPHLIFPQEHFQYFSLHFLPLFSNFYRSGMGGGWWGGGGGGGGWWWWWWWWWGGGGGGGGGGWLVCVGGWGGGGGGGLGGVWGRGGGEEVGVISILHLMTSSILCFLGCGVGIGVGGWGWGWYLCSIWWQAKSFGLGGGGHRVRGDGLVVEMGMGVWG